MTYRSRASLPPHSPQLLFHANQTQLYSLNSTCGRNITHFAALAHVCPIQAAFLRMDPPGRGKVVAPNGWLSVSSNSIRRQSRAAAAAADSRPARPAPFNRFRCKPFAVICSQLFNACRDELLILAPPSSTARYFSGRRRPNHLCNRLSLVARQPEKKSEKAGILAE